MGNSHTYRKLLLVSRRRAPPATSDVASHGARLPHEGDLAQAADILNQGKKVVILAGRGLSNAEIADRLFLSPRTVASHLYRSYPKLGIAGRHQLRDLTDQAGTARVSS